MSGLDGTYDVAIIGLGPVGGTLANILGGYGIKTVILERQPIAYHLPRAVSFDDEIMRVFQSLGLADAMHKISYVGEGVVFVDGSGAVLVTWPRPKVLSPNGWYVNYRFHQPALEKVLGDGMARYDCVTTLVGSEVIGIDQDENGVTLTYLGSGGGEAGALRAAFVVGCDGANSFTRAAIGSGIDDLGFNESWVVVDLLLKKERQDLTQQSVHYCEPERSATYVYIGGGRRRWEFRLQPGDDPVRITEAENIWRLLERWIGPDEAGLERAVVYTFRSLVAKEWRRGRVMIAGDAAHQTPPFMGQGMCSGIRDAYNLGWKLDRIVKGRASLEMLKTYQSERDPHVRAFIELTVQMGQVINTTASALAAGNVADLMDGRQKISQLRPRLGPGLRAGGAAWAGHLFPQPRLSSGAMLDDRIGDRSALILKNGYRKLLPAEVQTEAAENGFMVIEDASPELQDWFENNGQIAVMLRPDRYILGSATDEEDLKDNVRFWLNPVIQAQEINVESAPESGRNSQIR